MDKMTRQDLKPLLEHTAAPCVSCFVPMERAGKETRQNPIRVKNMLREAVERLTAQGMPESDAEAMLKPVQRMLDDSAEWQEQSDGLAIFCSPSLFQTYRVPLRFDELLVVAPSFHLKPLLPMFTSNGQFYILALSQGNIRLLQGTRNYVDEITLPSEMPTSIEQALGQDITEKQLQFHTNVPVGQGGQHAVQFHGQGTPDDQHRSRLLRYFLEIDRGMQQVLAGEQAPLVLAGVEYLLPLYHDRNTYPHLIEEGITGNPDHLKPEELHAQAWDIVEPYMQQEQQRAVERYNQNSEREQSSGDLRTVIPAAAFGRVDTLFVAIGVQTWGSFNPSDSTLQVHAEPLPGDEDLLDFAAVHTLLHSGTVYAVPADRVPGGSTVAALFRY
jgi:hypothetical protein